MGYLGNKPMELDRQKKWFSNDIQKPTSIHS